MTTAIRYESCKEAILPAWVAAGRIPNLDGLRAVGIFLVLCDHWVRSAGFSTAGGRIQIPTFGDYGVTLFFVISGFLITLLMLREFDRTGGVSLRGFYARRALRILPAYLAFLLFVAVLSIAGLVQMGTIPWLACLTYTVNFLSPRIPCSVVAHIWSLSVEEHFYLIWPLTVAYLGPKRASKVLVFVLAASPLLRLALWSAFRGNLTQDHLTPGRLDSIGMGCLLAYLVRDPRVWLFMAHLRRPMAMFLAFALAFAFEAFGIIVRFGGRDFAIGRSLESAGFAALILLVVSSGPGLISQVLGSRPMVGIGVLSYSLYLWQQPFLWEFGPAPLTRWPINIIAAVLVAIASYWIVERPFLKIKGRVHASDRPNPSFVAARPILVGALNER